MRLRRLLPVVLAFVLGGAVVAAWYEGRGRKSAAGPLAEGTPVTVTRPTGEVVTGMHGANPQPKTEKVKLVVYRVGVPDGPPKLPPAGRPLWTITVGDATAFAYESD